MLECSCDLPLPLHAEYALSYAVVGLRELAASNLGTNHVLQLDCRELQLICTRPSVGSGSQGPDERTYPRITNTVILYDPIYRCENMNEETFNDFGAQMCRHRCKPLQNRRGLARPIILEMKVSLYHDWP